MGGRDKGRGHFLALEVFHAIDTRAAAGDQGLGIGDVVQDPEQLDVLALAGSRRQGAGADLAELHVARGHGLDHVATAAKQPEVNFVAGGFFQLA